MSDKGVKVYLGLNSFQRNERKRFSMKKSGNLQKVGTARSNLVLSRRRPGMSGRRIDE